MPHEFFLAWAYHVLRFSCVANNEALIVFCSYLIRMGCFIGDGLLLDKYWQHHNVTQLSNLWRIPNSVRIGFDPAMKMGSSRRFKRYPTTYMWVSSWLPFTMDEGLSWFILIHSKGMPTWNSHIGCGVSLESSWWAHFHGRVKTYADWVWYLSKIGELWYGWVTSWLGNIHSFQYHSP